MSLDGNDHRRRTVSHTAAPFVGALGVHPAGSEISQVTLVRLGSGKLTTFESPSYSALLLASALNSSVFARENRGRMTVNVITASPFGPTEDLQPSAVVFDFFTQCISSVIMSFTAVEHFANEIMQMYPNIQVDWDLLKHDKNGTKSQRRRRKKLEVKYLDRASTDEKIGKILPQILGCDTPMGRKPWPDYLQLRKVRNEVVHGKSHDLNPRITSLQNIPENTTFAKFLNIDSFYWVRASSAILSHFRNHVQVLDLSWMDAHIEKLTGAITE